MKKTLIALSTAALFVAVIITGCSKDETDSTAPVITLSGSNPFNLTLNTAYADPGSSATDDVDGDLSGSINVDASNVNKDKVGSYTVNFTVSDAAGNTGSATRTVTVANSISSSAWAGSYSCIITTPGQPDYPYSDGCVISNTLNGANQWNKFGDYGNATGKLSFIVDGSGNVTLPTQSFTCGSPVAVLRQFSGSGSTTSTGAPGSTVVLQINETVNSISTPFTYTFTKL